MQNSRKHPLHSTSEEALRHLMMDVSFYENKYQKPLAELFDWVENTSELWTKDMKAIHSLPDQIALCRKHLERPKKL